VCHATETHRLERLRARATFSLAGLSHAAADLDELGVEHFKACADAIANGLCNLLLDEASRERLERLVKQAVLCVLDGELERVHLDVDILHVEDVVGVIESTGDLDFDCDTVAAKENIRETFVLDLGEARLLVVLDVRGREVSHSHD